MKNLLFIILLFSINSYAQPAIQWLRCYGGSNKEFGRAMCITPEGGYIMAGSSNSVNGDVTGNHANEDMWVVKTDSLGNLLWQKSYGGTGHDGGLGVVAARGGGYFLSAYKRSSDGDATCSKLFWVVHVDDTGRLVWQKCFDNNLGIRAYGSEMLATPDSGLLFVGGGNSSYWTGSHGGDDFLLVKLDKNGDTQWHQCYGGSRGDYANSICRAPQGGFYLAGYTQSGDGQVSGYHTTTSSPNYMDYWVIKVDSIGRFLWQRCLGGLNEDVAYCVRQAADGGLIVAGNTLSNDGQVSDIIGVQDYWIVKLDGSGNIQWKKCMGGTYVDEVQSIEPTPDSGFIMAGRTFSNDYDVSGLHDVSGHYTFNYDAWLTKINSSGSIVWQRCIGGTLEEILMRVYPTRDGGYIAGGYTSSTDGDITSIHGLSDYMLVKLGGDSSLAVNEPLRSTVEPFEIYPNPSEGAFRIKAAQSQNRVQILDILGVTVWDKVYDGAAIRITLDVPKGIYLVRLNGKDIKRLQIQ